MAIKKYKEGMTIRPGQFICLEAPAPHRVCAHPVKVVSVRGERAYTAPKRREFVALYGVRYVCDTEAEGTALAEIGLAMDKAVDLAVRQAEHDASAPFWQQVAAMVSE